MSNVAPMSPALSEAIAKNQKDIQLQSQTQAKPQQLENKLKGDEFLPLKADGLNDASCDGKFSAKEALKNFGKGLISPITAVLKNPLLAIGMVAVTAVACSFVPVLAPIMTIGFGALSVFNLIKGGVKAVSEYKKGNYDNSERAFQEVGSGVIGTALSALGVKKSAKVAAEAKMMNKLNVTVLNAEQKTQVASQISRMSWLSALKENVSLVTTKAGWRAIGYQFKPSLLKARLEDVKNLLKGKKVEKEVEKEVKRKKYKSQEDRIEEFRKSPEGIRRAGLTDDQIKAQAQEAFDRVFDELEVPKELRPKLIPEKGKVTDGGLYDKAKHQIEFNPESYRAGVFELDEVIMHEATHCKGALLRAGLSKEEAITLTKEMLLDRIKNGESERIVKAGNFMGPDMMDPPKMSTGMRKAFAQFADDNLYGTDPAIRSALNDYNTAQRMVTNPKYVADWQPRFDKASQELSSMFDKLKKIMKDNPDFAAQYKNPDEAFGVLVDYSTSHANRFEWFSNNKIGGSWGGPTNLNIPKLTPEQTELAIRSFREQFTTVEGNAGIAGFKFFGPSEAEFNQYQFSHEEVLAQQNGNRFLINNCASKIEQLKKAGQLTPETEAFMTGLIEKAKLVIEYKTKGLEYYEKYTKLLNNPNDAILAQEVKAFEAQLQALSKLIKPEEMTEIVEIIKRTVRVRPDHVETNILVNILSALGQVPEKAANAQNPFTPQAP